MLGVPRQDDRQLRVAGLPQPVGGDLAGDSAWLRRATGVHCEIAQREAVGRIGFGTGQRGLEQIAVERPKLHMSAQPLTQRGQPVECDL